MLLENIVLYEHEETSWYSLSIIVIRCQILSVILLIISFPFSCDRYCVLYGVLFASVFA
jgi:hypothetical protein